MQIPPTDRFRIGVVVERRQLGNPWVDHAWAITGVVPGDLAIAPWTELERGSNYIRYFAGSADLEVYPAETSTYKYNLESPQPSVYVALRKSDEPPGLTLFEATICPGEAHAHADTGNDLLEAVPMPEAVQTWLSAFVAHHHVEREFYKRTRDRADTEALGIRRPRHEEDEFG